MMATTIEQSKKLIELGIDVSTADMFWALNADNTYRLGVWNFKERSLEGVAIPAWSLDVLIDLLPENIKTEDKPWSGYHLYITKKGIFYAFYEEDSRGNILYGAETYNVYTGENEGVNSLVDAAVEMIVKLKNEHLL